jgi:hypothetical protein
MPSERAQAGAFCWLDPAVPEDCFRPGARVSRGSTTDCYRCGAVIGLSSSNFRFGSVSAGRSRSEGDHTGRRARHRQTVVCCKRRGTRSLSWQRGRRRTTSSWRRLTRRFGWPVSPGIAASSPPRHGRARMLGVKAHSHSDGAIESLPYPHGMAIGTSNAPPLQSFAQRGGHCRGMQRRKLHRA